MSKKESNAIKTLTCSGLRVLLTNLGGECNSFLYKFGDTTKWRQVKLELC